MLHSTGMFLGQLLGRGALNVWQSLSVADGVFTGFFDREDLAIVPCDGKRCQIDTLRARL